MAIEFDIETKIETGIINQLLLNTNIDANSIPVRRWEDLTADKVRPAIAVTVASIEQNDTMKNVFIASPALCTIAIFTEYTRTTGDLDGKQLSTIKGYVREAISCDTIINDINDDIDGLLIYDEGFIIGSTDSFEAEPRKRQSNIQLMIYATVFDLGVTASGGTEVDYTVGDTTYRAHIFTADGTFTVTRSGDVEYLVVGGGGGAGGGYEGGGGGAGGFLVGTESEIAVSSYAITVGAGGSGNVGSSTNATNGGLSSIAGIASVIGGGFGGSGGISPHTGASGASGGGSGLGAGGTGTQGNMSDGGAGASFAGGGGGGAGIGQDGGDGVNASPDLGGAGGDGLSNTYADGTTNFYSGGGGGGTRLGSGTPGAGGQGGGGDGENNADGIAGVVNTGGGGGGAGDTGGVGNGGAGGSGIVIIRYILP